VTGGRPSPRSGIPAALALSVFAAAVPPPFIAYPAPIVTRALALSTASAACALATVALAVLTPATDQNRLAGALGITVGGLLAPAALLAGAARD